MMAEIAPWRTEEGIVMNNRKFRIWNIARLKRKVMGRSEHGSNAHYTNARFSYIFYFTRARRDGGTADEFLARIINERIGRFVIQPFFH